MKKRFFDASVVFYDLCSTRIKQDELLNKKVVGIFKKTHISAITSEKTAFLLEKAIEAHDHALEYLGQLGSNHRCNNQPFRAKNGAAILHLPQENTIQLPINITDLWFHDTTIPITEPIVFGKNEASLADKLCRGGKIKVYVYKKNAFSAFFNYFFQNYISTKSKRALNNCRYLKIGTV